MAGEIGSLSLVKFCFQYDTYLFFLNHFTMAFGVFGVCVAVWFAADIERLA